MMIDDVEQRVDRARPARARSAIQLQPRAAGAEEAGTVAGKQHERRGEDDRDHARRVDPERDVRVWPPYMRRPTIASRTAPGSCAGACVIDDHDAAMTATMHDDQRRASAKSLSSPVCERLERAPRRSGRRADDAGEDDERDAVADAALGDLLAQPHDEDAVPVVRVIIVSQAEAAARVPARPARRPGAAMLSRKRRCRRTGSARARPCRSACTG